MPSAQLLFLKQLMKAERRKHYPYPLLHSDFGEVKIQTQSLTSEFVLLTDDVSDFLNEQKADK